MNNVTNPILNEALRLLSLGFSVFPVRLMWDEERGKFDKKPLAKWKDFQDRLPTKDEVEEWFRDGSLTAIGIVTGKISGVVVVDVEASNLKEIIQKYKLRSARVSSTISGGKHFFFKWTEEIRNDVKVEGEDFDIRGDGGFVVAPPSYCLVGEKKFEYKWEQDSPNMYLNDIPLSIKKKLKSKYKEESGLLKISELVGVEEGSRDNSLYKVACSLLRRNDPDDAWLTLNEINNTYIPPVDKRDLNRIFASAISFIKPTRKEEFSSITGEPELWIDMEHVGDTYNWVWEGLVAKGETTLLAAEPKKGKSTLLRHFFRAVCRGDEFGGRPTKKSKVLVISEEGRGNWSEYHKGWKREDIDQIYIWPRPLRMRPRNVDEWVKFLDVVKDKISELQIDLLVIDTIANFWPVKKESDEGQVLEALSPLYTFTEDLKIAVLLIHHNRKMEGNTIDSVRGSNSLTGWPAQIVGFKGAPAGSKNQRLIESVGRLDNEPFSVLMELGTDDTYKTLGDPLIVSKSHRIKNIVEMLIDIKNPVSVNTFWSTWTSIKGELAKSTMYRYFNELKDANIIEGKEEPVLGGGTEEKFTLTPDWSGSLMARYPYIIIDR